MHDPPTGRQVLVGIESVGDLVRRVEHLRSFQTLQLERAHLAAPVIKAYDIARVACSRGLDGVRGEIALADLPAARGPIPQPDLALQRPGERDGLEYLDIAIVQGARTHVSRGPRHIAADRLGQCGGQLVQGSHHVRVVFVRVPCEQPRGNIEGKRLVKVEPHGGQIAVALDPKASLILPNGHTADAEQVQIAIDRAAIDLAGFGDLHGA
ncbi:MAG: hypothetical protein H8D77_02405, partial [Chloroflexi bacterium]|nr:hypothetical protein [Chloroflexota bacterium]